MQGLGLRWIEGSGFRVKASSPNSRVEGLHEGFAVQGSGFRVLLSRISGLGFSLKGLRVYRRVLALPQRPFRVEG
jgi:hypothetical protein